MYDETQRFLAHGHASGLKPKTIASYRYYLALTIDSGSPPGEQERQEREGGEKLAGGGA